LNFCYGSNADVLNKAQGLTRDNLIVWTQEGFRDKFLPLVRGESIDLSFWGCSPNAMPKLSGSFKVIAEDQKETFMSNVKSDVSFAQFFITKIQDDYLFVSAVAKTEVTLPVYQNQFRSLSIQEKDEYLKLTIELLKDDLNLQILRAVSGKIGQEVGKIIALNQIEIIDEQNEARIEENVEEK